MKSFNKSFPSKEQEIDFYYLQDWIKSKDRSIVSSLLSNDLTTTVI